MLTVAITGNYCRVAEPDWDDPLDPSYAASRGQRWNPPGMQCLYLNRDEDAARANVARRFAGLAYGPADLDPATAPVLVEVIIAGWDRRPTHTQVTGSRLSGCPTPTPTTPTAASYLTAPANPSAQPSSTPASTGSTTGPQPPAATANWRGSPAAPLRSKGRDAPSTTGGSTYAATSALANPRWCRCRTACGGCRGFARRGVNDDRRA